MNIVKAENIQEEMELKMWFGTHTVLRIDPYTGTDDNILNILIFSNGYKLTNWKSNVYRLKMSIK
jgi:hypothetical protein